MAKHNHKLTVIVVPQTTKRSYSFTFAPAWLAVAALLFAGLASGAWFYRTQAESLRSGVAELEDLRKTNRLQQAKIEEMQVTAQVIQERLQELETLEQQIKQMTGQTDTTTSRAGEGTGTAAGRGGPQAAMSRQENLPTLGTLLPVDVKDYVLGRRDTLELDLKLAQRASTAQTALETADETSAAMDEQLKVLEESKTALVQGKQEIADHLDYIAHRPTGLPVTGARITDRFGWRWSPFGWGQQQHEGLDFAQDSGTPIYATADGVVFHAGWKSGGYGYAVMIDHGYGFVTLYAHMSDWNVENGQEVKRGEVIGWVGNTGLSTGPHVHYEVHLYGEPVDPASYLN